MNNSNDYVEHVLADMEKGMSVEAGRAIFERVAPEARPKWAANILLLVVERFSIDSAPINRIIHVACCPAEWKDGHRAFDDARDLILKLEHIGELKTKEQQLLSAVLSMAELVAKITYNETDPDDPFDEDSGWWIPLNLKWLLKQLDDDVFSRSIIAAVYANQS